MVPRPSILVYVGFPVHAFVLIKKSLHILVTGETSLEKNGQEAGPATPTSTTSHMLASERGETSATQEETSTAQAGTSTAQARTSTAQARTSTAQARTSTAQARTSTAQAGTSTAQVSLRNSGGLAVQTGRGDSSSPCPVYHVLAALSVSLQAFIEAKDN